MTKPDITQALRDLDAAPPVTDAQRRRGDALFERTVATSPEHAPVRRRRRIVWRVAAVAVAASVVAFGSAVLVSSTGGAADAFATYTPTPTPLTPAETKALDDVCHPKLERWAKSDQDDYPRSVRDSKEIAEETGREYSPPPPPISADDAILALAERRGDIVVLAYAGKTQGFSIPCMANMPADSLTPRHVEADGMTGSGGPRDAIPPREYVGGGAHIGPAPGTGGLFDLRPVTKYSLVQGPVGEDITKMTLHTKDAGDVEATIAHGYYTAWWPGEAMVWDDNYPMVSGRDHHVKTYTISLTLKDGTVIKDAPQYKWPAS